VGHFPKPVPLRSIYQSIDEAGVGNGWRIYVEDPPFVPNEGYLATALALDYVQKHKERVSPLGSFFTDVGNLPRYSFLVPSLQQGTSQHPGYGPMTGGDHLIALVYNAIRCDDKAWRSTLLVITYDEHGGFYDSIPPSGNVPAPPVVDGDWVPSDNHPFDFRSLGVRVPAVLVSAWLDPRVDATPYEHASIAATLKAQLDLPRFLTVRDENANSFLADQPLLKSPRVDLPSLPLGTA
jgi:phospholipase C